MSGRNEDNAAEQRLAAALGVAREQWPDAAALARVRRGVATAIAGATPNAGPTQARLLRQTTRGAWLRGGSLAVLIGTGFGVWRIATGGSDLVAVHAQPPVVSAQAVATTAVPAAPVLPLAAVIPDVAPPVEPALAASEARRKPQRARAPRVLEQAAATDAVAGDPESELALLRRALGALQSHPNQSLELAAQHERDYAHGIFGQEREVIAIDALLALQRTGAAEARARAFLAHYPRSAHAPRIRALLGHEEQANAPTAKAALKP